MVYSRCIVNNDFCVAGEFQGIAVGGCILVMFEDGFMNAFACICAIVDLVLLFSPDKFARYVFGKS